MGPWNRGVAPLRAGAEEEGPQGRWPRGEGQNRREWSPGCQDGGCGQPGWVREE